MNVGGGNNGGADGGLAHGAGGSVLPRTAIDMAVVTAFARCPGPDFTPPDGPTLALAFESCRLTAYQDSGGRWTIGWGHTGPEVVEGLVWTQEVADATFALDWHERTSELIPMLSVLIGPGQLAALQSFVYNLGIGSFETSHLRYLVNSKQWLAAAPEFLRFDHVAGREDKGLLHRRVVEALVWTVGCKS